MRVGLWVTIIYVAFALGGEYLAEQALNLQAVGIGTATQALASAALAKAAIGISIVSMTVGIALPSIQKGQEREALELIKDAAAEE